MTAIEQLIQDLRDGRIDTERFIAFITTSQRLLLSAQQQLTTTQQQLATTQQQLATTQQQLQTALQRIQELEQNSGGPTSGSAAATAKVDAPFSMRAEEKRQHKRGKIKKNKLAKKARRGRLRSADKVKLAARSEPVYPIGVPQADCQLAHTRPVWRLEDGRAVLIAYQIYRGPKNQYGKIPDVLGRSEFGIEIVVEIAYLVYEMGLSFDKACAMLAFLQNLQLRKSQVDSLLRQLARHWENEFEVLCTLLANSLVVHADETSWTINSVWALLSEKSRILLFGVHKDAETLQKVLDPATFAGLVVSDDGAVYEHFTKSQKCWAHLLRKAIKLTLQEATNVKYREFADWLLEMYRQACRVQKDKRLGAAGRQRKVQQLHDELGEYCAPWWDPEAEPGEKNSPADDFRLLVNEVVRLALNKELFTFVTTAEVKQPNGESKAVAGTNNEAERTLRGPAAARATGRGNKTVVGARRQTILTSVLQSLRVYLPAFTLPAVTKEVTRWFETGQSCFSRLLKKLKLKKPSESVLDKIYGVVDGS